MFVFSHLTPSLRDRAEDSEVKVSQVIWIIYAYVYEENNIYILNHMNAWLLSLAMSVQSLAKPTCRPVFFLYASSFFTVRVCRSRQTWLGRQSFAVSTLEMTNTEIQLAGPGCHYPGESMQKATPLGTCIDLCIQRILGCWMHAPILTWF